LTSKHQSHLHNLEEQATPKLNVSITKQSIDESAEDSEKLSGESSSAADSEFSLSEADEARFQKITEAVSPTQRPKKSRRSITTTTAQQIQEKKIAEFNAKLLRSLIYRQERDNQVRQSALRLKYNYFPSLDDDLWDWQRATPALRASFLRGVISRREYLPVAEVTKKPKKLAKADRRPSRSSIPKSVEMFKQQAKRSTRRSNTTGDATVLRVKHVKNHDKRDSGEGTSPEALKEEALQGPSKTYREISSQEEDV